MESHNQTLQDFETRFLYADTKDSVANWIKKRFEKMGYEDVVLDTFNYSNSQQYNVVATLHSNTESDKYIVVGGHHDSYSSGDPMVFAPGADDNASGTAAVLETARVLKKSGYQPEKTIKFVTFAAEEYGLHGSDHFAASALEDELDLTLMINHDMISHSNASLENSSVDINYYSGTEQYRDVAIDLVNQYTAIQGSEGTLNSGGSDSYSFFQRGFEAIYFEESDFTPFYHSPQDVIENCNMEFCTEVIKASCATILTVDVIPPKVNSAYLQDAGDGSSLICNWSSVDEWDLAGYRVLWGEEMGEYTDSVTVDDTSYTISNLTDGTNYYVGIASVDEDDNKSFVLEVSGTPYAIPLSPKNIVDHPKKDKVVFTWAPNEEADLEGYNIYRSPSMDGTYEKLNTSLLNDTTFVDETVAGDGYSFYKITAVDYDGNESKNNEIIRTRPLSLDQGILVVDATIGGEGNDWDSPTEESVDQFYEDILQGFTRRNYDIESENKISLADLGAYSTVLWHNFDLNYSNTYDAVPEIKKYLGAGGNFIYDGYRPSEAFENNSSSESQYSEGTFLFDFLKTNHSRRVFLSRFGGAIAVEENDYPNLQIDTSKTSSDINFHLRFIESISANETAENIYLFDSEFDQNTNQGELKGEPVGVEYLGDDFNSVTLSFPLYFIREQQAKSFMYKLLSEKFGEVTSIESNKNDLPDKYNLSQNYPNPFNPATTIKYSIPEQSKVKLTVYDILGRKVRELVNTLQSSGNYSVTFKAEGLTSGIYIYTLEAGKFKSSKKLIFLK